MKAHYESLLSRIHAEWNESDWQRFRESARVPNFLTTLHEAAHWFQRQTLVERTLHLVTVRALLEEQEIRSPESKEELRKVIVCRKLLSPISEGLALYTQFDYFPSNFFIGAGQRSPYDAMVEFLLARRGFEKTEGNDFDLAHAAWDALIATRLSDSALRKKCRLLETPFLIMDDHITGYLIVKASVARARCKPYGIFMYDGHLLPQIMSLFYNCPEIVRLLLDSSVGALEAMDRVSRVLRQRVEFLLDGDTLAGLVMSTRGRLPDFEHAVSFDQDTEEYKAAQDLYSTAYDQLLRPIRSSLGERIRPEQTVDNYLDETYNGKYEDPAYRLSAYQLLSSPHFGRLFTENVTIVPKGELMRVIFRSTNQVLDFLPSNSMRAQAYDWLRRPSNEVEGRLTEAIVHLHGLRHDFFHVSFISHERGLLTLQHNTIDYNIGYGDLASYLQDSYRIDQWLSRINVELAAFEIEEFKQTAEVRLAKKEIYWSGVTVAVDAVLPAEAAGRRPSYWVSGRDIFATEAELTAYAAFSLAVRLGDFSFESRAGLYSTVKRNLEHFQEGAVNRKIALRFVSSREPVCCVQRFAGRVNWWSFSCLL